MSKLQLRPVAVSISLIVMAIPSAWATQWDYAQCKPMTESELIQAGTICFSNGRRRHFSEDGLRQGRWWIGSDGVVVVKGRDGGTER